MCDTNEPCCKGRKRPQKPEDCTPEQVSECHGEDSPHVKKKDKSAGGCCCR